jgi:hypothetical protein
MKSFFFISFFLLLVFLVYWFYFHTSKNEKKIVGFGSTGNEVKIIQRLLNYAQKNNAKQGSNLIVDDGLFLEVDGNFGQKTQNKLFFYTGNISTSIEILKQDLSRKNGFFFLSKFKN